MRTTAILDIRRTALGFLLLAAAAALAQSTPDAMTLIRQAIANDKENEKKAREYMYVEREETRKKQGTGFKTEVRTRETFVLYGHEVHRLIAKDDKPLDAKEAKKEEERISKLTEKYKNEGEAEHRKQEEKRVKQREQERKFLDEVAQAYDFSFQDVENIRGRDCWVISAQPRPGFHPKIKEARFLPKLRFKVWIDQQETQWTKIEADVIDNITFGLFLLKLNKGGHFTLETTRVNDEVWLPLHVALMADARLLFKHFDISSDITYRDYRKFRTDARITGIAEEPPPPASSGSQPPVVPPPR